MDTDVLLAFGSAAFSGAIAVAAGWSARRSLTRCCFALGMAALALESLFSGLAAKATLPQDVLDWHAHQFLALSFLPPLWLCFSLSYARGNDRESLMRWRWPLTLATLLSVTLGVIFQDELLLSTDREAGGHWVCALGLPGFALHLLFLVSIVLVLMNLERTFRASVGTMRWRIKYMILGLGVLFVARGYVTSQVLLSHAVEVSLQSVNAGALILACVLMLRSLFRTGHFEVGVYASRSLLQSSLTLTLAGLYLLVVGVLAKIVAFLGGDASFSLKAFLILVSLVLLALLLLSDRVRLATRHFVSRHFGRPLYDYRTVWRTFTEGTVRRVEQSDFCGILVRLVSDVFQALSVSVWLVNDRKDTLVFAASTALSESKAAHLQLDATDAAQVIAALSRHPEPLDLDMSREIWASALRRLHPGEFSKGGNRIAVPMIAGGELLGVMTVGDRVGGMPFVLQDLDLLKTVSEQAATTLLNIQLSQRLFQSKQLEAFQAMSAFFVHDLKNTASTLSLMLQNLPRHYNDPQFREDALRGISKTVTHVNELISRLSLLRQELSLHPVECDLNELADEALKCLGSTPQFELVRRFQPLPKVRLDPAQIQNVITNLTLNARDALGPGGRICVETRPCNDWVILEVADNGCGMTPEFMARSLFRPFQTTKKSGLGIGMFQCKMIVETHRGRIEVESTPGQGSVFRVWLPITPPTP